MATAYCSKCNVSLGVDQQSLPGVNPRQLCIKCETDERGRWMLKAIADEGTMAWNRLSEFEQGFVKSVRGQVARDKQLSEKQYAVIERIYKKD